ncbi:MAG TPA: hypothetical protein VKV26_04590, partial [Dehalococcoidia bacterium]|nr:hypothetical protein [Dehalococcoidia bacterium]
MASPAAAGSGRTAAARTPSDLLSVVLLVAVLAPGAVVFSGLDVWARYQPPWPAFVCGTACCGLAATARRPGWLLVLALALGLAATYATLLQAQPGPGLRLADEQARLHLLHWLRLLWRGEAIHDDLAVSAWTSGLAWLAGMWAAWAALRAGWHWLVLTLAGALVLSSIGYTHNWPAGGLIVFLFAALLYVSQQQALQRRQDAVRRGLEASPATGRRAGVAHTGMVLSGAAGLVALGWLIPAAHWRLPRLPENRPPAGSGSALGAGQIERPLTVLHDFGSVLPFSGPVAPGDGIVATVQADGPGYVFGISYDRYEGNGWATSAAAGDTNAPQGGPGIRRSGGLSFEAAPPYLSSSSTTLTVTPAQPATVLLAAGPPLGLAPTEGTQPPRAYTQWLKGAPAGEFTALIAASPLQAGATYATAGLVSSAEAGALRRATTSARGWLAAYTQLPPNLP